MTLHLHRAARTDVLADGLGELLAVPLADPFAPELVLVPARGVERWLSQRLSHRLGAEAGGDGVCAGVEFRSPRSLVAELTGTVESDPWAPDSLTWPLLSAVDDSLDEPWCRPLAVHLGHAHSGDEAELRRGRRHAVARRIAGLFASYAAQRPRLLADWLAGRETDGAGRPLDADLAWQPELWRALVARVEEDPPHVRHAAALARLRAGRAPVPDRLSLFGHTRLPLTDIELLGALATHHDLHLWLPHPSDGLWRALRDLEGPTSRRADTSHRRVGHPLLATLGRDLRELQRSLTTLDHRDDVRDTPEGPAPASLLGWLQADLRADRPRPAGRVLAAADRSVQVHSCHGPGRQVEVLREVLLGLLQDDPTLEPRDVLVMCPDIEAFAPLVTAAFGLGEIADGGPGGHPAHELRVRLADRALTQTNPLLAVAAALLDLAGGRATASQVLDLAHLAPVRSRFGFTDDDLDVVVAWTREAGVRWGFDAERRAAYGLDGFVQNTWRFGLDRVLAGVALSDDSRAWLGPTLPLDDVGSNRIDLAGRLAEYVDRVSAATADLSGTRPLAAWLDALEHGVTAVTRVQRDEAWQSGQLRRELAQVRDQAGARTELPMRLADVRSLLSAHLAGRPTRANFRAGTLTVCTMVPMRSVPHRVVCLVGLDDGTFPRIGVVDGDDVLAREPVTGERDVRSEDRQLLLDAILAATDTLVVTYTGANEHTGQRRPPAVPLGELLDALDATTSEPVRERIVVEHPLQPFDVRNLTPGALVADRAFSFDPWSLDAARAISGSRSPEPGFLPEPLPPYPTDDVGLDDLVAFFRHPVKGFFRALDLTLPWEVDGVSDAMPVEIDQLEAWGVGDRMLADMVRLVHPEQALQAEWRRGVLPPGQLGWRTATEVRDQARQLAVAALTHRQTPPTAHDVEVDLGAGRRLTGTVSPVYADRLVTVGYSRLGPRQLAESWVRLLALAASDPGQSWTALAIGRGRTGRPAQRLLGPVPGTAADLLRDLVAVYDAGRREPLPLPLKTSHAWAAARLAGEDPRAAAEAAWKTRKYPGEDADPAHVRVWDAHAPLDVLLGGPRGGERVDGEDTRLGAYAVRLWRPLLRTEKVV